VRIEHSKCLHLKRHQYKCTRFYIQLSFKVLINRNVVNNVYNTTRDKYAYVKQKNCKTVSSYSDEGMGRVVRLSENWCCVFRQVVPEFVRIIMSSSSSSSSSSTSWITWPSGQKKPRFFKTSGTTNPTTKYHIPNDLCLLMENTRYPLVTLLFVVTEYRTIIFRRFVICTLQVHVFD
jgi:hypothetical protein